MERNGFVVIAVVLLAVLLLMTYQTQSLLFATLFAVALIVAAGFYLFQFGELASFSLKALSTEASFIKEKAEQVKEDAEAIRRLRDENKRITDDISAVLESLQRTQHEIEISRDHLEKLQRELVSLKVGFVEITFLQYSGRNIFPNPYDERIMARMNELLAIAIPDSSKRSAFIQELQQYTEETKHSRKKAADSA